MSQCLWSGRKQRVVRHQGAAGEPLVRLPRIALVLTALLQIYALQYADLVEQLY
jgi:hypothetical protein